MVSRLELILLVLQAATTAANQDLHFLRIAKTGSTGLLKIMHAAKDRSEGACASVVTHQGHGRTYNPDWTSFVIIREPCERFASIFEHMKAVLPEVRIFSNAEAWGLHMLANRSYFDEFQFITQPGDQYGHAPHRTMHHMVPWAQAAYIEGPPWSKAVAKHPNFVGCLPTLHKDVQRILDHYAPGCDLGAANKTARENVRQYNRTFNPGLCKTVRELYPRDFELYDAHCCCQQPELTDGPVPARPARPVGVAQQAPPRAFLANSEGNPGAGEWALKSKPGQVQATKTKQTRTGEEAKVALVGAIQAEIAQVQQVGLAASGQDLKQSA
mmetsp:Transcript_12359/g.29013  ORF Transcript_12359/g.29013 Transcript_12359/m.29013 type:complete len:327 (-) Transcript_12359:83-1063(-)